MFTKTVVAALLLTFPLMFTAYSMESNENKKTVENIEQAEEVDQELGATEGVKPKPVKQDDTSELDTQFQARQGFQQQPDVTSVDTRR